MPGRKRESTIAALLSSAPALAPVPDDGSSGHDVSPSNRLVDSPVTPNAEYSRLPVTLGGDPTIEDDLEDTDPEAFTFAASVPLVRARKRKSVDYQTVRLFKSTWQPLRQAWLMARKIDPLVSFTEFASVVVQVGLQTLKQRQEASQQDSEMHG